VNPDHHLRLLLERWRSLADFSAPDVEAVLSLPYTQRSFPKEAYIVREGQAMSDCCLLLRGFAYRHKLVRDGCRQIISFHIPGEFVDLQNAILPVADHNVQSLDRTEAALIPHDALLAAAEVSEAVRKAMWIETLLDASIFREWVVNVGRRDSRSRIAHLLCELAFRLEKAGPVRESRYDFPMTQEQLADATGLTPVHTNRTLQSLRRDGLIDLSGRSLTVLDWDKLREVGDFDELYLHHRA
jgi:CRP-like cAMP-binding protein